MIKMSTMYEYGNNPGREVVASDVKGESQEASHKKRCSSRVLRE